MEPKEKDSEPKVGVMVLGSKSGERMWHVQVRSSLIYMDSDRNEEEEEKV